MKAFVLIKGQPGRLLEIVDLVKRQDGVKEVHVVFGPYDAVAIVERDSLAGIGRLVTMGIQPVPGVIETMTCLMME
jgi:DNA-binding Lrp family transcriptional regulator